MLVSQNQAVGYFDQGSYLVFNNVDFGSTDARSIHLSIAKDSIGGSIDVRLNNLDGETICSITPSGTGGWDIYQDYAKDCINTSGQHDIYIVGVSGDGIANIDYFEFSADPVNPDVIVDVPAKPILCVFDYDLTLSSNKCAATENSGQHFCRTNSIFTYSWTEQCLGLDAQAAVARCVAEGAYIGIASHAPLDTDYNDKVAPIVSQNQFPEFLASEHYNNPASPLNYPAIDDKNNWNCDDCAYHMNPSISKPEGIRKVMRHYGLDPNNVEDKARVIFWDDSTTNINAVDAMGDVNEVFVPRNQTSGDDGGCGITNTQIEQGWQSVEHLLEQDAGDDFVLMVVPDTQYMVMDFSYRGSDFGQYTAQTSWIASQKDTLNIKYIAHLGDVVDHVDVQNEWDRFKAGWADIENSGIPWSIAPGNHDTDLPLGSGNWDKFNQEFPTTSFLSRDWFVESYPVGRYENNLNFFEASGMEFMVLSIGDGMAQDEFDWADNLLKAHSNRRAIISTHDVYKGEFIQLAKQNTNVFLIVSGHYCDQEWHNVYQNDAGQDFHEIMTDYQCDNNGVTRYYQFKPSQNMIEAVTYNPQTGDYWMGPTSRFSWEYGME